MEGAREGFAAVTFRPARIARRHWMAIAPWSAEAAALRIRVPSCRRPSHRPICALTAISLALYGCRDRWHRRRSTMEVLPSGLSITARLPTVPIRRSVPACYRSHAAEDGWRRRPWRNGLVSPFHDLLMGGGVRQRPLFKRHLYWSPLPSCLALGTSGSVAALGECRGWESRRNRVARYGG